MINGKNEAIYDDSQIAMKIAVRSSLFVATSFFILWLIQFYFSRFPFDTIFELLLRIFLVIFWLLISKGVLAYTKDISNTSGIPFLSTVFFYGMTLLVMTILQLGLIIFHIAFSDAFSLMEEIRMLFWVHDFSINSLFSSLILGHVPYIIYFFYLRFLLYRITDEAF